MAEGKRSTRKMRTKKTKIKKGTVQGECLSHREFEVLLSLNHRSQIEGDTRTKKQVSYLRMMASEEQAEALEDICALSRVSDAIADLKIYEGLDLKIYDFNIIIKAGMDARSRVNNGSIRFAKEDYDWVRMTGYNPMPTLTDLPSEMVIGSRGN
jgi:hypothetical protein